MNLPRLKAKVSPSEWTQWKEKWEKYSTLSKPGERGLAVQLWHCLQDTTRSELSTRGIEGEGNLVILLKAIQENVLGYINMFIQRVAFSKLNQHEGETVTTLLERLQEPSRLCEFRITMETTFGAVRMSGQGLEETKCGVVVRHRANYRYP